MVSSPLRSGFSACLFIVSKSRGVSWVLIRRLLLQHKRPSSANRRKSNLEFFLPISFHTNVHRVRFVERVSWRLLFYFQPSVPPSLASVLPRPPSLPRLSFIYKSVTKTSTQLRPCISRSRWRSSRPLRSMRFRRRTRRFTTSW